MTDLDEREYRSLMNDCDDRSEYEKSLDFDPEEEPDDEDEHDEPTDEEVDLPTEKEDLSDEVSVRELLTDIHNEIKALRCETELLRKQLEEPTLITKL